MDSNIDSKEPALNEDVSKLHEGLAKVLGGPQTGADELEPYWDLQSDEFEEFFLDVIEELSSSTQASTSRSRGTRSRRANAPDKLTNQPPTAT